MKKYFKNSILIIFMIFISNFTYINGMEIKKIYSDEYMKNLHSWLPNTFEELKSLEDVELNRMAIEKYHYHQDKSNFYTKEELEEIESYVNIEKLNEYFVEKLNLERKKLGLSSNIKVNKKLIEASKIRARELSMTSKLSHIRANKSEYWTVFEKIDKSLSEKASFENILKVSLSNEAQMVSEEYLANTFFYQWKESKGHWGQMTDKNLKEIGLNFSFGFSDNKDFLAQMNYAVLLGIKQ